MHDMALVSYALFKNRDGATEFRNLVLKGAPWNSAINQKRNGSRISPEAVGPVLLTLVLLKHHGNI